MLEREHVFKMHSAGNERSKNVRMFRTGNGGIKPTMLDEYLLKWKRVRQAMLKFLRMRARLRVNLKNRDREEEEITAKLEIVYKVKIYLFVNAKIGEHNLMSPILDKNESYVFETDSVSPNHFFHLVN